MIESMRVFGDDVQFVIRRRVGLANDHDTGSDPGVHVVGDTILPKKHGSHLRSTVACSFIRV